MTSSNLPVLTLRRNEERPLAAGHLWVYSNEVDVKQTPLGNFEPGDVVQVEGVIHDIRLHHPEATLLVLAPSPGEARDSSLSHMFTVAIREVGAEGGDAVPSQAPAPLQRGRISQGPAQEVQLEELPRGKATNTYQQSYIYT